MCCVRSTGTFSGNRRDGAMQTSCALRGTKLIRTFLVLIGMLIMAVLRSLNNSCVGGQLGLLTVIRSLGWTSIWLTRLSVRRVLPYIIMLLLR